MQHVCEMGANKSRATANMSSQFPVVALGALVVLHARVIARLSSVLHS